MIKRKGKQLYLLYRLFTFFNSICYTVSIYCEQLARYFLENT